MTARQCCGARGRRLGDERTRARAVLGSERLGDERTQRPDFWLLPPTRRRKWRRGEQLHAADRGCCQWLLPVAAARSPTAGLCSLPSALSRAAVVSTCMHPPNTAPPSPRLSQCHHGACSQRRPVRRVASAVLWKSRVLRRARSSSDAEHGSRICMQVLTTAPSILFSLSGLLALERVRGS